LEFCAVSELLVISVFVGDSSPALLRHNTSSAADITRLRHIVDNQSVGGGIHQICDSRGVGGRPLLTRSRSDVTRDSVRMSALSDSVTVDSSQMSSAVSQSHSTAAAAAVSSSLISTHYSLIRVHRFKSVGFKSLI